MLEMQQRQLQLLESMAKTKASGTEEPEAVPQATEPLQEQVSGLRDAVVQQSQMLHHFLARVDDGTTQAEVPAHSRAASKVVHQLGHLQVIEEQLLDLKADGSSARGKDAHQVYRELLLLQDLQRQLQDLGTSEASSHRGAAPQETLPSPCPRFGAGVSADAVQWGDLQLQLHEQLLGGCADGVGNAAAEAAQPNTGGQESRGRVHEATAGFPGRTSHVGGLHCRPGCLREYASTSIAFEDTARLRRHGTSARL
ncbi:unnamed protein product [Cladocopium goreaui]|uniref:Uncharacterized protein n=1 Tax=Cladocopium goreaui TaxID=2562237 RepID=A0A9P1FJ34_9DINO|nr:unnamed protein product [Cladocopium goreaui]